MRLLSGPWTHQNALHELGPRKPFRKPRWIQEYTRKEAEGVCFCRGDWAKVDIWSLLCLLGHGDTELLLFLLFWILAPIQLSCGSGPERGIGGAVAGGKPRPSSCFQVVSLIKPSFLAMIKQKKLWLRLLFSSQRIPEPARTASVRGIPAQEPGITAAMGTAALLRGA